MSSPKQEPPRGVLNEAEGKQHFQLSRFHPHPKLTGFVEHFWIVRWDLVETESYKQDILSHPSVHLVFERGSTRIWGIITNKFTRFLEGKGKVLGIKFRPGGFFPFYGKPVSRLQDKQLAFSNVFNEDVSTIEANILDPNKDSVMAEQAELFLLKHLPQPDPKIDEVCRIIDRIQQDTSILKVDQLVERLSASKRTLQRLFQRYVGVSPKWVIQRHRLHEAAEQMASAESTDWSQLALKLGYYDQSHFIRDFKAIVGQSPGEYARKLESTSP